jgi:hypothetical protein
MTKLSPPTSPSGEEQVSGNKKANKKDAETPESDVGTSSGKETQESDNTESTETKTENAVVAKPRIVLKRPPGASAN